MKDFWIGNNFKWVGRVHSAAISMFCGTVITGLFELGVSHLDLEVSKFNFWSLMFDVVFLTCLSADQIYLRALNTWTKLYFETEFFILDFFYWTSPPRRAVLTKNISVNFVNLEHSVEWSEYFGMVNCHVGVLEHSRNNSRNIHQESIFSINGIWQNRAIFCWIVEEYWNLIG